MQAAGRVGDQHVDAARLGRAHGIEHHCAGVGAARLLHDLRAAAFGPDVQLLGGGGAEGVARGQHHLAAFTREPLCQLADAGGLARAVHAHDHDDERTSVPVDDQGPGAGLEDRDQLLAQCAHQRLAIGQFAPRHAGPKLLEDLLRGGNADVGADQPCLELIQQFGVDLAAAEQSGEVAGEASG